MDTDFDKILGRAVFQLWPDLPRDIQQRIFETTSISPGLRNRLAALLHDHHPRTVHPPMPID